MNRMMFFFLPLVAAGVLTGCGGAAQLMAYAPQIVAQVGGTAVRSNMVQEMTPKSGADYTKVVLSSQSTEDEFVRHARSVVGKLPGFALVGVSGRSVTATRQETSSGFMGFGAKFISITATMNLVGQENREIAISVSTNNSQGANADTAAKVVADIRSLLLQLYDTRAAAAMN